MHIYEVTISWKCNGDFEKGRYDRAHDWAFDGGAVVRASSSPLVVPIPFSDASAVDPEPISAVDAILGWDPARLELQGATVGCKETLITSENCPVALCFETMAEHLFPLGRRES